jgi:hypothetical protein
MRTNRTGLGVYGVETYPLGGKSGNLTVKEDDDPDSNSLIDTGL